MAPSLLAGKTKREFEEIRVQSKEKIWQSETFYHPDAIDDIPGLAYSTMRQGEGDHLNTGDWKRQKNHPRWKG